MRTESTRRATLAPLLLCALTMASCATQSPPTPPVAVTPPIPSPPVKPEPTISGQYWSRVCSFRLSLQARLNVTLPTPEPCMTAGEVSN